MIDITEARTHVLDRCPPLAPRDLPFRQAIGTVLAAPVHALEDVPPFANSAVDGYAVVASSIASPPTELPVVGEVAAGASTDRVLQPGEAIRIMTGAPVPSGADAVVMVEDTERLEGGDRVRIHRSIEPGVAVRAAGDDVRVGTELYGPGTLVTPAVAAVLASVNAAVVSVVPKVRVAVLSTGDELVDDGRPLAPGQIRESNRTMLVGLVRDAGCEAVDYGIVRDDEAALEAVLRSAAAECDAIVTSGGVSMGDYDVVKAVLSQIADMRWMQIAIKPAKPFAFGLLSSANGRQVPVFGLPGNPVSSLVSFELLARPALRQMAGVLHPQRPTVQAVAVDGLPRRPDGKIHYMRVFAEFGDDGRVQVRSIGAQGSHQLAATSMANAIAEVPDGDGVEPGGPVRTLLLWVA
ncbi:MAG: molybdopterin molybdotransferase MoeA [Actinobacteria bacterium]|nr:molybdopterin molybdotransferase MoeA [Actinomycetota bacterium]